MAEQDQIKNDQNTEIIPSISSQPIRENLVATAVHFLNNPRVNQSPLAHKTSFLQKKGLTVDEINLALARTSNPALDTVQQPTPLPNPVPILARPHSVWYHIHRIGSSFIIIGIALYGAHQLYKLYLEPWLFGDKSRKSRLTALEQQLADVNQTLNELKQNVSKMHEFLNSQKMQMSKIDEVVEYFPSPLVLNDLKAEVSSIKSLLLNRHQFPAVPKVSPSIPIWQMQTLAKEEDKLVEKDINIEMTPEATAITLEESDEQVNAIEETELTSIASDIAANGDIISNGNVDEIEEPFLPCNGVDTDVAESKNSENLCNGIVATE